MTVPIQQLAERMMAGNGMNYRFAYSHLKAELARLTDADFAEAVARVDNPGIFRYLYSAGLSFKRQQICTERWEELTK